MEFSINNGQGLLYIGWHRAGISYLNLKRPLSVEWYDGKGSVAQYAVLLPYSHAYREQFLNRYREEVYRDYSTDIESLHHLLSPLWSLFENGTYELEYHPTIKSWDVQYANETNIDDKYDKVEEYRIYKKKQLKRKKHYCTLLDYSTANFYPAYDFNFFATQSENALNKKRVKYFEEIIKEGERPFVLIFRAYMVLFNDMYSNEYVLDGHHKLEAYKNLNIPPAVAIITRNYGADMEELLPNDIKSLSAVGNFNLELLKKHLYPWQLDDIVKKIQDENRLKNNSSVSMDNKKQKKNEIKIFAEIGIGNPTFCNTEIEKGTYEHRVPKFITPPKIEGVYLRVWIGKRVFVVSTKNGVSWNKKDRIKLKVLFGVEGVRYAKPLHHR